MRCPPPLNTSQRPPSMMHRRKALEPLLIFTVVTSPTCEGTLARPARPASTPQRTSCSTEEDRQRSGAHHLLSGPGREAAVQATQGLTICCAQSPIPFPKPLRRQSRQHSQMTPATQGALGPAGRHPLRLVTGTCRPPPRTILQP